MIGRRTLAFLCALACTPYFYLATLFVRDAFAPLWVTAFTAGGGGGWIVAALVLWERSTRWPR